MNEAMNAAALFNPLSPEFREDPYPSYARLREAGAALPSFFGSTLVTRYDEVDSVLRSSQFRTPRGYRDPDDPAGPPRFDPKGALSQSRRLWLLFQTGEPHTRVRRLLTKVFTPRAVSRLAPRVASIVDELLDPALARGSVEVMSELAYPLPVTVICELLGIPESDRDVNRRWATMVGPTVEPILTDEQVAAAEHGMAEWDAYFRRFIAERRTRPGDGLIDAMLAVEDEGARLSDDEVVANAMFLFIAGHETTTNLIGNGLFALLQSPAELEALRAEPALVEGAIEELLRFDSPVQATGRVAIERAEIAGVAVEPGMNIMVLLGSANRDPRRYERPEELDVRRKDPKPLSFGGGPHYCVGAALARLESKVFFARLLEQTRSIALKEERPPRRPFFTLRGLERLPVELRA